MTSAGGWVLVHTLTETAGGFILEVVFAFQNSKLVVFNRIVVSAFTTPLVFVIVREIASIGWAIDNFVVQSLAVGA